RHGTDAKPLDAQDAALARSLADHVALAITNARMFAEATRMTDRLRLSSELAREFAASTDDFDALLQLVARRVGELFGDLCLIRRVDADGRCLDATVGVHRPDPEMVALVRAAIDPHPQSLGEGITGRVAATGEPVIVPVVDLERLLASLAPPRRAFLERYPV